MSPTYTFPNRKSGHCPECGARRTVNRSKDGSPKDVAEIEAELRVVVADWQPDFTCTTAAPSAVTPDD